MPAPLSGPGLGLQLPQNLYPSELNNAPYDTPTNDISLAPGDTLPIPAGDWYVSPGMYSVLQFLDPVTNLWTGRQTMGWMGSPVFVKSDGFNYRVANLTGCITSLSITAPGSGYVQGSTSISFVGSTATAQPVIGGQLALVGGTINSSTAGAGYGVAPMVFIPAPPPAANNPNGVGGVQASGFVTIAGGTISGFSFTNPGAGYPTAPQVVVVPSATDPNLNLGITQATLTFSLTASGSLTGAMITNPGAPLTNGSLANVTVTVSGAGTGATVTPNVLQTIVAGSVVGTGLGYGTVGVLGTTAGGAPSGGTFTNSPNFLGLSFRPRPANISFVVTGGGTLAGQTGSIVDGGLFLSAPAVALVTNPLPGANVTISGATVSYIMGSRADIVTLQPAP